MAIKGDRKDLREDGSRTRRDPRSGVRSRRTDPYEGYDEYEREFLEDEEDYEEFARRQDRLNERRRTDRSGGGRQQAGRRGTSGQQDLQQRRQGQQSTRLRAPGREELRGGGDRRSPGQGAQVMQQHPQKDESRRPLEHPRKNRKRRRKKGFWGILWRLLVIVLLIGVIAVGLMFYRVRDVLEMQRVNSVDLEEQLMPGICAKVKNDERMKGYKNIALFGVDSRTGDLLEGDNRSDTIMIASINEKTGEIRLISVYRDTILDVGEGYYTKANTAYALGGPARAITMLNQNLDMNILDFVTVGFEGLAHTIDALGGIEIEIDEEEREYLNQYVHDMHIELGTDETPVEETGVVTVTGIQATAYSRIRYTAGDDFRRAERQRTVLQKTLDKAKAASPTTLVTVANNVVGDMATSLSSSEIVSLILKAQKLELVGTGGVPQEDFRGFGTNWEEGDYVVPLGLEENVQWLHSFLFGDENYILSEEAAARNEYIRDYFPANL